MAKARGSIQNIYNTLAFMQSLNPTLLSGQVAYYKDTVGNKLVVGDGVTPFMSLVPMFGASIIISAAIPLSSVGNNGDIAILTTPGQIAQKTGGAWAVVYTFPSGGGAGTVTAVNSITPTAGNVSLTADNIPAGTTNKYWTKAATDTYYLPLSGGTLVGPLVLSADPTAALQAATKAYVDRAVLGSMKFQGVYSAATNLPNLPVPSTANNGFYWLLSDSGTQYGFNFNPGDWIVSNGQNYEQVNNTGPVFSVLGRTGAVIAVTGDYNTSQVTENTNLYFTSARATGSLLTGLNLSLTGTISASDTLLTAAARLQSQINSAVSVSSMNAAISAALVPYVTSTSLTSTLGNYVTNSAFTSAFSNYSTTTQMNTAISAAAILNQTTQQASANFNISGAGVIGGALTVTGLITAAAANFSGIVGIGAAATAGIGLTITNAGTEGLRINATTGNSYLRFSVANTVMATIGSLNSGFVMNLAGNFYCNPGNASALLLPGGTITSGINRGGISFNVDGNQGVGNKNVSAGFSGQYNYDNVAGSHLWTSTAVSQASPTQAITVSQVLSIDNLGNGILSGQLSAQNINLSVGVAAQSPYGIINVSVPNNATSYTAFSILQPGNIGWGIGINSGLLFIGQGGAAATNGANTTMQQLFTFNNLGNFAATGSITSKGTNKQIVTVTANYTVLVTDEVIQCQGTTGAYTVTLPAAGSSFLGKVITIIRDPNSSGATITVTVASAAAIQSPTGGYGATVPLGLSGAAGSRLSYINNGGGGWVLLSSF